jgi:multidrug efflux pump
VLFATIFTLFVIPASYGLLARRTASPQAMSRHIDQMDGRIKDIDRQREGGVA